MSSENTMLIFDILILILGVYGIVSAVHMKNTGIPSAILISKQELPRVRNAKEFCKRMYQPTIVFSSIAVLYGVVDLLNQYVLKLPYVDLLGIVCFLIVCAWFVRELNKVKGDYV